MHLLVRYTCLSLLANFVSCLSEDYNRSVILVGQINDYCIIKCNGDLHTLCIQNYIMPKECGYRFNEYVVQGQLKWDILNGHNGIRNRVAKIMGVSNMVLLQWDQELSRMASVWLRKCAKYISDPCTELSRQIDDSSLSHTLVNQNRAFIKSRYFPPHLITTIIRDWYLEKNNMKPPYVDEEEQGSFLEKTNFTQLVWAQTHRIGCALARYDGGYHFVCNYFPFEMGQRMAFREGVPCSICPNDFPLCDTFFTSLCTTDKSNMTKVAWKVMSMTIFALFACLASDN